MLLHNINLLWTHYLALNMSSSSSWSNTDDLWDQSVHCLGLKKDILQVYSWLALNVYADICMFHFINIYYSKYPQYEWHSRQTEVFAFSANVINSKQEYG